LAPALPNRRADPRGAVESDGGERTSTAGCQTLEYISSALVDLDLHFAPSADK